MAVAHISSEQSQSGGGSDLVAAVLAQVLKSKTVENPRRLKCFIGDYYYAHVSEQDLKVFGVNDLYNAALSSWAYFSQCEKDEVKLRVFNPTLEENGWHSAYTVVELVQSDMPFLIDTMLMELNRLGLNIHHMVHTGAISCQRDKNGKLVELYARDVNNKNTISDALLCIEIDCQDDKPMVLAAIRDSLLAVLKDVHLAVTDFQPMCREVFDLTEKFKSYKAFFDADELQESIDFLQWLTDDHFTFLGFAQYRLERKADKISFIPNNKKMLGISVDTTNFPQECYLEAYERELKQTAHSPQESCPLLLTKSDYEARVHRRERMDIVACKLLDASGQLVGICSFWGLYTTLVRSSGLNYIPFLRRKETQILERSGLSLKGHAGKAMANILHNFPRDELFHINTDELLSIATGMLQIQERQRIRLFTTCDIFNRYYTCMVFVPRDRYNTDLRIKIQNILMYEFMGVECSFKPNFMESVLCRIDFVIRVDPNQAPDFIDIQKIEARLVAAAKDWNDELFIALKETWGDHKGALLYNKYSRAFPMGYKENFLARSTAMDVKYLEQVEDTGELGMCFYRLLEEAEDRIRFKLFQRDNAIPLSKVLPILENMGLMVYDERPYKIRLDAQSIVWITDFSMQVTSSIVSLDDIRENFQEAFAAIWKGRIENDLYNCLVVRAGLSWQEILILRAITKFVMQIGMLYDETFIQKALCAIPMIAVNLIRLFEARFDPGFSQDRAFVTADVIAEINQLLEDVPSLDEDKIVRRFIDVVLATVRTNYYQDGGEDGSKTLAFKITSNDIPQMPSPVPLYEVFVYSPIVEGVHLRASKVARGGIRCSMRVDFRSEVLGLMKTQQVKNAVIVPLGAKGGFIVKPEHMTAQQQSLPFFEKSKICYKLYIQALLGITDNIIEENVISPEQMVIYDDADTYFVVAADKGTATFSDMANEIAESKNFWMGDAFASGGSNGYDHKAMGITARGAWESIKRHFISLNIDCHKDEFTVVGVGDMSGDVFGNGMLYSKKIKLIAAFNHEHIFIDPDPDSAKSYQERKRLFVLPGSKWSDYAPELISKGGGVFNRLSKVVPVSDQMKKKFNIEQDSIEPDELIHRILMSEAELFFNGGIGTFIKSSSEAHVDVTDRANDRTRINGDEAKFKVIGEGGNLGITQLARVEFALNGGLVFTDAIDNSGGVDCSDHEVLIKILLDIAVKEGKISVDRRNEILLAMCDDVSELVLTNNYHQALTLSHLSFVGAEYPGLTIRTMRVLERAGHLRGKLEFLPSEKVLKARLSDGSGLTTPEMSVIMAYAKNIFKRDLALSDLLDESYYQKYLAAEFPSLINTEFSDYLPKHPLRREIIAMILTNKMFRYMGYTFVQRIYDETGAGSADILRVFVVVLEIFDVEELWMEIEALDGQIEPIYQADLTATVTKLLRRACRCILRTHRSGFDVVELIGHLQAKVREVRSLMPTYLSSDEKQQRDQAINEWTGMGVEHDLAERITDFLFLFPVLDIIEGANRHTASLTKVVEVFYELNQQLSLAGFRAMLYEVKCDGYWGLLAISALRDDLDKLQRILTLSVLDQTSDKLQASRRVEQWMEQFDDLVARWLERIGDLRTSSGDYVVFAVAIRGLLDLAQVCLHADEVIAESDDRLESAQLTNKVKNKPKNKQSK